MLLKQDEAKMKADKHFYDYCEYTKYWTNHSKWENHNDFIIRGIRLAIGQYMQHAVYEKIKDFSTFVECLSPDFCGGSLIEARDSGDLPRYRESKARKYRIGKGYAALETGHINGYAKQE